MRVTKHETRAHLCYSKRSGWGSFRVDPELWSRFKGVCAERGVSICYVLEGLIEAWIQAQRVQATLIQPVHIDLTMQHVVQRPRRLGTYQEPEILEPIGCRGLEHREWAEGRAGWCHVIRRWVSVGDCARCPRPKWGE